VDNLDSKHDGTTKETSPDPDVVKRMKENLRIVAGAKPYSKCTLCWGHFISDVIVFIIILILPDLLLKNKLLDLQSTITELQNTVARQQNTILTQQKTISTHENTINTKPPQHSPKNPDKV
jgi:cell division protein FtsL